MLTKVGVPARAFYMLPGLAVLTHIGLINDTWWDQLTPCKVILASCRHICRVCVYKGVIPSPSAISSEL